ncbi:unnamed protein product (macronuclear) [Paramecium tetraurelia]|uniref:Uncharacterized protein n=1 Tax=Paramecium tetraurelia TaxID=5888 RepID=A0DTT6_PARTE|nr:uncharacterized protein GSPATT00020135001 [Paramecium tetraurelia]CAK86453.1 unnamed protein product [Paramecium tetraurelia]|eukprot:XP_001453850.1 hypothetical protein (macronuclear) [Paramecium tetraurelia strain d4-2]
MKKLTIIINNAKLETAQDLDDTLNLQQNYRTFTTAEALNFEFAVLFLTVIGALFIFKGIAIPIQIVIGGYID